jgi:hypothetical protein
MEVILELRKGSHFLLHLWHPSCIVKQEFEGSELGCSGRVGSSYSTSDTRGVTLVTNPMINHELRKDREMLKTKGTYPLSVVTQKFSKD